MSFELTRRAAMRGAAAAAVAAAVPAVVLSDRAARAATPGTPGKITYKIGPNYWIADADGSSPELLAALGHETFGSTGPGCWAPDGSRFYYSASYTPTSVKPDGTARFAFPWLTGPETNNPAITPDGRFIFFIGHGQLHYTAADGTWSGGEQVYSTPDAGYNGDLSPAISSTGTAVFVRMTGIRSDIYRIDNFKQITKIVTDGARPDFSPDGSKLVFERGQDGEAVRHLFVADADGGNEAQLTTEAGAYYDPAWSPDGKYILCTFSPLLGGPHGLHRIDVATKEMKLLVEWATEPTWQPITGNFVERVWGQTALGTSIATSRYNWADRGVDDGIRPQAKAVVLSRDDTYQDALGGSALAVAKEGPLLITPRGGLDPATKDEIERVLGNTGTVYLLGGTLALSTQVENQVRTMGYTVTRLWGQNEYDTAVAIAKAITPSPRAVIVATSLKYYDALAAGAAAGANPGTVIVLTAGDTMPAATAAYLNTLNPDPNTGTMMVGVGGPGARALQGAFQRRQMPSWKSLTYWPVYGATEFETAVAVAEFFFSSPRTAAVATASTWFDALTGGAMVGSCLGPLLLSTPGTLSPQTEAYFSHAGGSIKYAVLLGGPLALQAGLVHPLSAAISLPGQSTYTEYTETYTPAAAARRSLAATETRRRAVGETRQGEVPGARMRRPQVLGQSL